MSKNYLLSHDYENFTAGSLFQVDNEKLINLDSKENIEYMKEITDKCSEVSQENLNEILEMPKEKRIPFLNQTSAKGGCTITKDIKDQPLDENQSQHNYLPTEIFLLQNSKLVDSEWKDSDDDVKFNLVKVRWKEYIYGAVTKTYEEKIMAMSVLPASTKSVTNHIPHCQFTNNIFGGDTSGILVDNAIVEKVKGNLIFEENRGTINEDYILQNLECNCKEYSPDEPIKFIDGLYKVFGRVISCHTINKKHCLKVKFEKEEKKDAYILDTLNIKRGLKNLTKYIEGVVIDQNSIFKMENFEFESFHVGDQVSVMLRDSGVAYPCNILWLGKVNEIDVAAVNSETMLNNSNLMCDGTFNNVLFFEGKGFIVTLMALKILMDGQVTSQRLKEQTKQLKDNKLSATVLNYLQTFNAKMKSLPINNFKELLNLSKSILKQLRDYFVTDKLENRTTANEFQVEQTDEIILKCSQKILNILCELCVDNCEKIKEVSTNKSFVDYMENVLRELSDHTDIPGIKKIVINLMILLWFIIKGENKRRSDWLTRMNSLYYKEGLDPNIKMLAALSLTFLVDKSYIVTDIESYLRTSYQNPPPIITGHLMKKNDILIGLGKILLLKEMTLVSSSDSNTLPSSSNNCESSESTVDDPVQYATLEQCDGEKYKLSVEEYEDCIKLFVVDDKLPATEESIANYLAKLNNDEIFRLYITKQKPMEFGKFPNVIQEIKRNDASLKSFLDNSLVRKADIENVINLAQSLFDLQHTQNIGLLLEKILPYSDEWDFRFLSLAGKALLVDKFDILKTAFSKCKDVNSYFIDGETFMTWIIKQDINEDQIIEAIKSNDNFDYNKENEKKEIPLILASKSKKRKVYNFLLGSGKANFDLCYGRM